MLNNCRAAFSLLNVIVCPILLYSLLAGELSHRNIVLLSVFCTVEYLVAGLLGMLPGK